MFPRVSEGGIVTKEVGLDEASFGKLNRLIRRNEDAVKS
jgi:hypothetical protein